MALMNEIYCSHLGAWWSILLTVLVMLACHLGLIWLAVNLWYGTTPWQQRATAKRVAIQEAQHRAKIDAIYALIDRPMRPHH
jgi:hypothetical protein